MLTVTAVEKDAANLLAELGKLQSELDGMHYTVQAWMALALPSEVESVDKATQQHKVRHEARTDSSTVGGRRWILC